jgi:hypothetical protein
MPWKIDGGVGRCVGGSRGGLKRALQGRSLAMPGGGSGEGAAGQAGGGASMRRAGVEALQQGSGQGRQAQQRRSGAHPPHLRDLLDLRLHRVLLLPQRLGRGGAARRRGALEVSKHPLRLLLHLPHTLHSQPSAPDLDPWHPPPHPTPPHPTPPHPTPPYPTPPHPTPPPPPAPPPAACCRTPRISRTPRARGRGRSTPPAASQTLTGAPRRGPQRGARQTFELEGAGCEQGWNERGGLKGGGRRAKGVVQRRAFSSGRPRPSSASPRHLSASRPAAAPSWQRSASSSRGSALLARYSWHSSASEMRRASSLRVRRSMSGMPARGAEGGSALAALPARLRRTLLIPLHLQPCSTAELSSPKPLAAPPAPTHRAARRAPRRAAPGPPRAPPPRPGAR